MALPLQRRLGAAAGLLSLSVLLEVVGAGACPEDAQLDIKHQCVDGAGKSVDEQCCAYVEECEQAVQDLGGRLGTRMSLYMGECKVQEGHLELTVDGTWSVKDASQLCSQECLAVAALEQPFPVEQIDALRDKCSKVPAFEMILTQEQVIKALDDKWEQCKDNQIHKPSDNDMEEGDCPPGDGVERNVKGDCVNSLTDESLPQVCCSDEDECEEFIKTTTEKITDRMNLYLGECKMEESDFAQEEDDSWKVVETTHICSRDCQKIKTLMDPLPTHVFDEMEDRCFEVPEWEQLAQQESLVRAMDAAFQACSTVTTTQAPIMCQCNAPGELPPNNDFECTDGSKSRCSKRQVCFSSQPFLYGLWANGCLAYTTTFTITTTPTTTTITTTTITTTTITTTVTTTTITTTTVTTTSPTKPIPTTTKTSTTTLTTTTLTTTTLTTTSLTTTTITITTTTTMPPPTTTITTTTRVPPLDPTDLFEEIEEDEVGTVYVIDRSGSMSKAACTSSLHYSRYDYAAYAAMKATKRLRPNQYFNIVLFDNTADAFKSQPVLATNENIKDAEAWLGSNGPRGGTNIEKGLLKAYGMQNIDSIHLLSDGAPAQGCQFSARKMPCWEGFPKKEGEGIPIDTTLFFPTSKKPSSSEQKIQKRVRDTMKRIATYTGGTFREPVEKNTAKCPPRVGNTLVTEMCGLPELNGEWFQAGKIAGKQRYKRTDLRTRRKFQIQYNSRRKRWELAKISTLGRLLNHQVLHKNDHPSGRGLDYPPKNGWTSLASSGGTPCRKMTMIASSASKMGNLSILLV